MVENNIQLLQRPGESDFQYHKRLVYGKLEDKTLADYDYTELSKYVYGKEFSGDVARRLMYGSKRTLDLLEREGINQVSDSDIVADIDSKMNDLRKEQQRFYDQRREFNKMLTVEARREHLDQILVDAIQDIDVGSLYPPTDYIPVTGEHEAVLVFSDWHYGMTTDNIFNKFNTQICKQRITKTVANAIERIKLHECDKLHIIVLGDLYAGAIHTSARVASEELVVDQLMHVSEILAQSINELSGYVNSVLVYTTYGNHARVIPNKKDNIHHDNFERIVGWWLEQRLSQNTKVKVVYNSENEFIFAHVCGHDICAVHGDIDSVRTSPRLLTTLFHKEFGLDIDCIILGDKHHRESFEELGVTSILCGALCGADDYASDKRLYSTPSQLLLIFDHDGIDAEYRLRCE